MPEVQMGDNSTGEHTDPSIDHTIKPTSDPADIPIVNDNPEDDHCESEEDVEMAIDHPTPTTKGKGKATSMEVLHHATSSEGEQPIDIHADTPRPSNKSRTESWDNDSGSSLSLPPDTPDATSEHSSPEMALNDLFVEIPATSSPSSLETPDDGQPARKKSQRKFLS